MIHYVEELIIVGYNESRICIIDHSGQSHDKVFRH